jgi:hypothetical protein
MAASHLRATALRNLVSAQAVIEVRGLFLKPQNPGR